MGLEPYAITDENNPTGGRNTTMLRIDLLLVNKI
jgi:hypothetical protein